jgi:hypothetical protein
MWPELEALLQGHPFIAAAVSLAIGWFLRHRGIGSGLPAGTDKPATGPLNPAVAKTLAAAAAEKKAKEEQAAATAEAKSLLATITPPKPDA